MATRPILAWWGASLLVLAGSGCDLDLAPPPPPSPVGPADGLETAKAHEIILVLPGRWWPELGVWEQAVMIESGRRRAHYRLVKEEGASSDRQAELIRQAPRGGGSPVLIVVPGENPEALAPAIEEVRRRGVPVVLLGEEVPGVDPSVPAILNEPIDVAARALVDGALQVARREGMPADGPAQIVIEARPDDPRTSARMEAVKAVLREEGVTVLPDLTHRPGEKLRDLLYVAIRDGDPRPRMIFADEDAALMAAAMVEPSRNLKSSYLVAGFVSQGQNVDMAAHGQGAAIVDRQIPQPAIRAVAVALALADGEAVAGPIVIPNRVRIATGPPEPGFLPMQAVGTPSGFSGSSINPK